MTTPRCTPQLPRRLSPTYCCHVRGVLSVPVLLILAWGIGLILVWEHRHRVMTAAQLPWIIAAMVLILAAMVVALLGVPGQRHEQFLRVVLAAEACGGALFLARRLREVGTRDR